VIGSLRGRLLHRGAGEVLVEVGGVGYVVVVSPTTVVSLGELGDEVFVWTHHHVREDAEVLYGFPTRDERVTFEALLGAHGVRRALAGLGYSAEEIRVATAELAGDGGGGDASVLLRTALQRLAAAR
jgi:Holliday junction DNA helicase RuvA